MKEKIPHRSTHCCLGGELFSPGSSYISVLLSASGGWGREDYCPECWNQEREKKRGPFWQGKIPIKQEKVTPPDQKAMQLFQTSDDPKLLSVLALYLSRRGSVVKRAETKTELYYEIPETGEVMTIPKITLSAKEITETLEQFLLDDTSE